MSTAGPNRVGHTRQALPDRGAERTGWQASSGAIHDDIDQRVPDESLLDFDGMQITTFA
jgi:hypothetical protein